MAARRRKKRKRKTPNAADCFLRLLRLFAAIAGMSDKLTEIMAHKRVEIAPQVRPVSLEELAQLNANLFRPPSFATALRRPDGQLAVIAEIKRRSPSAGAIKEGI